MKIIGLYIFLIMKQRRSQRRILKVITQIKQNMTNSAKNLKNEFELVCEKYIDAFVKKQDLDFDGWIGDVCGGWCFIEEMMFDFQDIRHDIDENVRKGEIVDWYNSTLDAAWRIESERMTDSEKEKLKIMAKVTFKTWLRMEDE